MNSTVYILLIEDRHTGVDAVVYSSLERANLALEQWISDVEVWDEDEWETPLHPEDLKSGICRSVHYSCENDYISILRREIDSE